MSALLVSAIVSGILVGMVYGLIGAGLNIVLGVMKVVNFAHGDFLMLASYAAYWLSRLFGFDPFLSLAVIAPVSFIVGIVIYYATVPRLLQSEDPEMASYLAFFGISLVISGAVFVAWGADPRALPYPYGITTISLGIVDLPLGRLIAFGVSVVGALALLWFLYRTYLGKAIRATVQNRDAVQLLGVDIHKLSALTFGIGILLVGVAGTITPLIFPSITYDMGISYTLIAFTVIVLGGLGDPLGALVGGVIFGLTQNISMLLLPAMLSPLVAFALLIVVIMVRPQGIIVRA